MMEAAVRIAALFSYCGGPLFIADALRARLDAGLACLITFLPVGLMVVGSFFLYDDPRDRLSYALVRAGRQGLYIVLAMHVYALSRFMDGVRVPEQYLHYIGIAVGVIWSFAYLRAARRWAPSRRESRGAGDQPSTDPIEPS